MWSSFSSIKDLLQKNIKNKGLGAKVETTLILEDFSSLAEKIWDKETSKDMRALYIRNKILTVAVLSSVLAQEIKMKEELILSEIRRRFGKDKVNEIKIVF